MPQRSVNALINSLVGADTPDESNKAGRADRMPLQVGPMKPEDYARMRRQRQIQEATTTGESALPRPASPIQEMIADLVNQVRPSPGYMALQDAFGSPWEEERGHMNAKDRAFWFASLQNTLNPR